MLQRTESLILRGLLSDGQYANRVLPHIAPDFFSDTVERTMFAAIQQFLRKYKVSPTKEALLIDISNTSNVAQDVRDECGEYLTALEKNKDDALKIDWLIDETERWCKDRYIHVHVLDMIETLTHNGDISNHLGRLATPPSFTIQTAPGLDSASPDFPEQIHAYLTKDDARIPFDVEWLNKAVRGVKRQTLSVILAPTNHGKSLFLCHLAAQYMRQKFNVLYVTLEMDEQTVAVRIHANLLNTAIEAMETWNAPKFRTKISALMGSGRLVVRGFPTGTAHVGHFRAYLEELKSKSNFVPDIIIIDYLNICASERMKSGSNVGLYQYVGAISKELRALGQTNDAVVWTATQTNRSGLEGDVKLSNTSDSLQTAFDADLVLSMWKDEKVANLLHLRVAKDRNGSGANKHGLVGVDYSQQKLHNLSDVELSEAQSAYQRAGVAKNRKTNPLQPEVVFEIDIDK